MLRITAIFQCTRVHQSPIPFLSFSSLILSKSSGRLVGLMNYTNLSATSYKSVLTHHLGNRKLVKAREFFNDIPHPSVHLYTMMIDGYANNHKLKDALQLFYEMPVKDTISWNSMLKGCLNCGDLSKARQLFDEMPERNVISWTTMVNGFMLFGEIKMAELFFHDMPTRDIAAWNAMINGYLSNGRMEEAIRLFEVMPRRNVISWTSMIGGIDENGKTHEAFSLFQKMVDSGFTPTSTTFVCVLTASSNALALHLGVQVHAQIIKFGHCFDEFLCASLITFYSQCEQILNARKILEERLNMNVVVWTALVTGYSLNSKHESALTVFCDMVSFGVLPNQSSLTSALNACSGLESIDGGKVIHSAAIKLNLETDVFVCNSLIVMYGKCGNINDAIKVFTSNSEKNIVTWNSIIVGCAQHGYGMWVLILLNQMIRVGIEPDEITFTGLLSACSHSGMLQKGKCFFKYFSQYKTLEVKLEHYACMVDILGRCGKLEEAEVLVKNMPLEANSMVWLALLSGCRMHSNLDVAERAAARILNLEPHCSAAYVLLSNVYASVGRWSDVSKIRWKMKHNGIVKQPGTSWVTYKGSRHEFVSGDRSHPLSQEIYQKLDWLVGKMKEFGYVPDQQFALHDVEAEQKEEILSYHSERLAIGFGLITTVEGSTITVMKNLRVCGDCHAAVKLIAKIAGREIVVRDSMRFHHFKNGSCSCGDYW